MSKKRIVLPLAYFFWYAFGRGWEWREVSEAEEVERYSKKLGTKRLEDKRDKEDS